ncbi:MAG: polymer-forming cytoskeletal protein [Acidobacteria bacterium]|nr:polymer-forming cytoskeletal protein [Acidobacteriota bacterium]
MLIAIAALLLFALFALPFLPGILEWVRKQDAEPLFISMEYIRNPRYFGKSFRRILKSADFGTGTEPGIYTRVLSKEEKVEVTRCARFGENLEIDRVQVTIGELISSDRVLFNKEVYVAGNAVIGRDNVVHAIAGDGDITLGEGTKCRRWIDAEGTIRAGADCRLGISASSGEKLLLGRNCSFRRIFGMPILTGQGETAAGRADGATAPPGKLPSKGLNFVPVGDRAVAPGAVVKEDIVFLYDVEVGSGVRFEGSIKAHGALVLKDGVVVTGNIFSEGDIIIGKNAAVYGHVFSQKTVRIAGNSAISGPDKIKSVVGKKAVFLEPDVTIYGYVTTEGEGRTIGAKCREQDSPET